MYKLITNNKKIKIMNKLNTNDHLLKNAVSGSVLSKGSFIKTDNNDIVEVLEIRENKCRIIQENGHISFVDYERLSGDKLTNDWLLTFGFELHPWGYVKQDYPLIRFSLNPNEKYWIELGNGFKISLPFVHTLQNVMILTSGSQTDR